MALAALSLCLSRDEPDFSGRGLIPSADLEPGDEKVVPPGGIGPVDGGDTAPGVF